MENKDEIYTENSEVDEETKRLVEECEREMEEAAEMAMAEDSAESKNTDNSDFLSEAERKKKKKEEFLKNAPNWVMDYNSINEVAFCKDFVSRNPMICVNGKMYDFEGIIEDNQLVNMISQEIIKYVFKGLAKTTKTLVDTLKIYCYKKEFILNTNEIHLPNGTLNVATGQFFEEKAFCQNRLNVEYNTFELDAYYPEKFLCFLYDLLDEQDIMTLQEYLGYCLIPSTKGQTALFLIGNGGEGKSRIGVVLKEIFGNAMISSDFQRIENDRFFLARLVNKLILVDDDMQMDALKSTGRVKALITAETPMEVEEKGKQSYPAWLYTRLICFGNGSPKTLYDKSDGFSRRLIILTTKPKPPNRIDDPFICDKFIAEKEKIFRWMLDGLYRLIGNNFRFTLSEKTKNNVKAVVSDNCNIGEFLEDKTFIAKGSDYKTTGVDLYAAYEIWCRNNALSPLKRDTFISYLKTNERVFNIAYDKNVRDENNRLVRGFKGLKVLIRTHI